MKKTEALEAKKREDGAPTHVYEPYIGLPATDFPIFQTSTEPS